MAVTREQIAKWSKNFEAKNPGTGAAQSTTAQGTTKKSVSREQISQWSQNFEQQEKQKKQQAAGEQLNKVTSGLAAGGQMAQQNPAVKYNPVNLKQVKPPENPTDAKAKAVTQSRNQQWDRERHASDIGEVDARQDEMSTQLSNDVYAQVNNWKDASTRNRELYDLVDKGEPVQISEDAIDMRKVSDNELRQRGYRPDEIRQAHAYADAYGKLNLLDIAKRRLGNTGKAVVAGAAGGTTMAVSGLADKMVDSPEEQLTRRLKSGRYTDQQLADVYGTDAVSKARERLESGKTTDDVRDEDNPLHDVYSWGRDTHKESERLMADAQAGEDEGTRFLHGAATSAAENLALASINPALVLPVLSAQGAGDSMAQSDANGESMTTALLKAGAKFGAGWAINSVGAADLAKTMGSDYAKDTLAGQIADWVKGMAGSSDFAMAHPAVANAISGGMDNAMQAFVETYADKAIDAALGDSEAAQNLFSKDTFVAALESGLSGGASGAMGGAVGTGLRGMSEAIDRASGTPQSDVDATAPHQPPAATASPEGEALADTESAMERKAAQDETAEKAEAPTADAAEAPDVVNVTPTKIETPDANAPEVSGSSRGTIDTSAEMADRGHPETPLSSGTETTTHESVGSESGRNPMASIADEGGSVKAYEDEVLTADEGALDGSGWASPEQKAAAAKLARAGQVSTQGVQTMVDNMPGGIGAQVYTQAAKAMYRAGVYNVESFEKALNATGPEGTMGGAVRQVMALGRPGETALKLAYLQGKGEAEAYSARKAGEIGSGKGFVRADAGTVYNGEKTLNRSTDPDSALLDLTAKSTGTVVHRMMEGLANNAKGCIRAAAGEMYFAGDAGSETVMHETFHALNEWSGETGQAVMDRLLASLVERNGAESTEKLLQSYLDRYAEAGVKLTYNQALEEVTADAMETVFGTEESFRDFVRQQAAEARMNADARGTIDKVMGKIQNFLESVLKDVKRFLKAEPTNAAARAAKNLTEQQLADLRALYFEHQMTAGEKLREAMAAEKENKNAAPSGKEDTAVKYSIDEGFEKAIDELDEKSNDHMITVGKTSDVLKSIGVKDQTVLWNVGKIRKILAKHSEANYKAGKDKSIMTPDIIKQVPQVLEHPVVILHSNEQSGANQGKNYGSRVYMFGEVTDALGKPVSVSLELLPTNRKGLTMDKIVITSSYGKNNVQNALNSDQILYIDPNQKRTAAWLGSNGLQLPVPPTMYGSKGKLTYFGESVKMMEPNSRNAKLAEFLGRDTDTKYQLEVDSDAADEAKESGRVKYSIDVGFEKAIDELDEKSTRRYAIRVGATSEVLKSIGVKDRDIFWQAGKLRKIMNKHSEANHNAVTGEGSVMTKEILKQVPQVLEKPIIVLHSDTTRNADYASRIFMYGDVKDAAGKPVNVSLELLPTDRNGLTVDNIVVLSAYGHEGYRAGRVIQGEILYTDPDTKRTTAWLRGNRLRLPFSPTNGGAKATLQYSDGNVKAVSTQPLPGQRLYYLQAVTEAEARKLYPADGSKADTKYQLEVDSDAADEAKESGLGDVEKQTETIRQAVEAGGNARVSEESLADIARAVRADHGSKVSARWLTERLGALSDYLSQGKAVDWADANAFVMDMAEQIMQKSSKKNDELWKAYPELHQMSLQIQKGSSDQQELVYRYGSMANARREAARHGVKLTYTKDGAASRWDGDYGELKKLGAVLFPDEAPASAAAALEAMMSARDAIKPTLENAYDEDWDGAKQDIAMQIWQRYMNAAELANEQNAGMREDFAAQWRAVRQQARQEAADARAKAVLELSEKRLKDAQWASRELAKRTVQEKARRDAQVDRIRDMREMDNTRRAVRRLTSQLNGMLDSAKNTSAVPESIAKQVLAVAQIANDTTHNTVMLGKMRKLGSMISQSAKDTGDRAGVEWMNSGLDEMIESWLDSVDDSRETALARVQKDVQRANKRLDALFAAETKAGQETGSRYGKEEADLKAYLAHLKKQKMEYEDGGMARMTADQLRGLREILEQTVHIIRNENKLLGEEQKADIDDFAKGAAEELRAAKGLDFGDGLKGRLSQMTASYRMNSLDIERQFERMGGYVHGGYMERMGQMLNEGQYKKTSLIVEGTSIFDDVTGKGNLAKMDRFEHELIDIGLKAEDGRPWRITRAMAAALYIQCQNQQGLHHMTHGGLKIPNMEYWVKGDRARAEHDTQTIRVGDLKFDTEGHILNEQGNVATDVEQMKLLGTQRGNLLTELSRWVNADDEMGEYIRRVLDDYNKFLTFTQKNINETSMVLSGRKKAIVEHYIPQRVDEDTRAVENDAVRYDNSVGNEGFLQPRKNSSKPIYLDDIFSVVNGSLENVAQYAGMAIPLRNVSKLMSTQTEGKNLNAAIKEQWGRQGAQYMEKAIGDLYPQRNKAEVGDRMAGVLRGAAAGAVLTFNLNVTLMQAASLPTAAAELGWGSTGHAAVQFGKNLDPVNKLMSAVGLTEDRLKVVEAEIAQHGDALLQYRLRGTKSGELSTAAEAKSRLAKVGDAIAESKNPLVSGAAGVYDVLKNSIAKMDEVTVAALWEGAKDYVVKNPGEFDAQAQEKGSPAYWAAVNRAYQRAVERTQPNYTTMQRTGFQRSSNQLMKFLMMYSTQRQQNMQIVTTAFEDLAAQKARYKAKKSEESKMAMKKAGERAVRAVSSQVTAAAVISLMSMVVKFALHRRKDLQDENGDMSLTKSAWTFLSGMVESLASNPVGGSEVYSTISSIREGNDYDAVSVNGISSINDLVANISTFYKEVSKDTEGMDAEDYEKHVERVKKDLSSIAGSASQLLNVPYSNLKKYVDAVCLYIDDFKNGTLTDFNSLPASATGQYDRLYSAIQSEDSEEAAAALGKLEKMGRADQVNSQLTRRLKAYDEDILTAAKARNAGKTKEDEAARRALLDRLCRVMGSDRRTQLISVVNKAVNDKADELLRAEKGLDKDAGIYAGLTEELETGRTKDVQAEIDRLLKAGKDKGDVKKAITNAVKNEYLAGSDGDRERLEKKLLDLKDAEGEPLYEEKNFTKWVNDAEKEAEEKKNEKNWWD